MDEIDRKILHLLQNDASLAISEIASQVHLSTTPCWKRIRRMEQEGVIRKRVALLDAEKVGAGFTVFVSIRTNQHTKAWFDELWERLELIGHEVLKVIKRHLREYDPFTVTPGP